MPVRIIENLQIQRWANGGDGIGIVDSGELEGLVVFVPKTVPGDSVDVELQKKKKRWARGRVTALVSASEHRVEAACRVQDRCGGCPWMTGSVDVQRRELHAILESEVQKRVVRTHAHASISIPPVVGGKSMAYRNRLRLAYKTGPNGDVTLGFRQARSGGIVNISTCDVALPELTEAFGALRSDLALRPNEEGEVRLLGFDGKVAGSIEPRGKKGIPWGHKRVSVQIAKASLELPPTAFIQGNAEVASRMADSIETLARKAGGSVAVELFCGAGTFTVPLLRAGYGVSGYDIAEDCGRAFDVTTSPHGEAIYHQQDLFGLSPFPAQAPAKPDLVLLDPPRSGAGEVLEWILGSGAGCVLMVSCDLATGLRDAEILMAGGFRCVQIQSYDLFPHTGHQELIIELRR